MHSSYRVSYTVLYTLSVLFQVVGGRPRGELRRVDGRDAVACGGEPVAEQARARGLPDSRGLPPAPETELGCSRALSAVDGHGERLRWQ